MFASVIVGGATGRREYRLATRVARVGTRICGAGFLSLLDPTAQDALEATLFDCGETRGLRPDPLSLGALALLLNPAAEQALNHCRPKREARQFPL
jgi:hypothetical protein